MHDEHAEEQEVGNQRWAGHASGRNFLHAFADVHGTGDRYRGEFVFNDENELVRWGQGVLQYANGSVYEGQWQDGAREGLGRLIHGTGDAYEGEWRGDKANGYGIFSNLQGYRFEGQWKEDCQDGLGMETW